MSIPLGERRAFSHVLTLFGSYHIYGYNLFYANIRVCAKQPVSAYRAAGGGAAN